MCQKYFMVFTLNSLTNPDAKLALKILSTPTTTARTISYFVAVIILCRTYGPLLSIVTILSLLRDSLPSYFFFRYYNVLFYLLSMTFTVSISCIRSGCKLFLYACSMFALKCSYCLLTKTDGVPDGRTTLNR